MYSFEKLGLFYIGKKLDPDKEEIMEGMSGNLCRCAAYPNILKSAIAAADTAKQS